WVALGILGGIAIGHLAADSMAFISNLEIARINIPVAILIWLMIYPMMLQIDFSSIKKIGKRPKGVVLTLVVNWLIKPFTVTIFTWLFISDVYQVWITAEMAGEYIAGAIILGAAPCTAMVFVWSYPTNGDRIYTLVQG